jgi:hypothetical protein
MLSNAVAEFLSTLLKSDGIPNSVDDLKDRQISWQTG